MNREQHNHTSRDRYSIDGRENEARDSKQNSSMKKVGAGVLMAALIAGGGYGIGKKVHSIASQPHEGPTTSATEVIFENGALIREQPAVDPSNIVAELNFGDNPDSTLTVPVEDGVVFLHEHPTNGEFIVMDADDLEKVLPGKGFDQDKDGTVWVSEQRAHTED